MILAATLTAVQIFFLHHLINLLAVVLPNGFCWDPAQPNVIQI
jgi:hypothetical protein